MHFPTIVAALPDLPNHLADPELRRMFREWAGVTPKEFLQHVTLEAAKERLAAGRSTLAAAQEVGLSGNGRLHELFVKMEGCTPGVFGRRGAGARFFYDEIVSPFGPLLVAETERGLSRLAFLATAGSGADLLREDFPEAELVAGLGPLGHQVARYFADWRLPDAPLPLDLRGTPFQLSVWRALLTIPAGHHLSYGDVADRIGKPRAVRAVGTAIGRNPVAYLIPCHRVIRESGAAGGYRWGLARKAVINGWEGCKWA